MLITAAERAYARCRCSQSAALRAPRESSRSRSCGGMSAPRSCTTFLSASTGHFSLATELLRPASCRAETPSEKGAQFSCTSAMTTIAATKHACRLT